MSEPTLDQIDAKLETQESLHKRYGEVRARNLVVLRTGMPDARFRALAKGETSSAAPADAGELARLRAENEALSSRLATLEQIVLERETAPKAAGARR